MVDVNKLTEPHVSYSQLSMASGCMRKYFYKYIEKIPMLQVWGMVSGKCVHKGLELHNLERMAGQAGLRPGELIEAAVAELRATEGIAELVDNDGAPVPEGAAVDLLAKEALSPITTYLHKIEPELEEQAGAIEAVEHELDFTIAGERCLGYVDKIRSKVFFDYKLVGRQAAANDVQYNPQLRLYEGQVHRTGALIQLMRGQPKVHVAVAAPNPAACNGTADWAASMVAAIKQAKTTGVWPRRAPGSWECSEKFCPFFRKCFAQEVV